MAQQPQQPQQSQRPPTSSEPTFVITTDGQIRLARPETPRGAPSLGPQRPTGPAPNLPNMLQGAEEILPVLLGILAAPFTAGMSVPMAAATTGGASAFGEMARQRISGEPFDPVSMAGEGLWGAVPTGIGHAANTSRRGGRMIQSVVAEGLPAGPAERLTAAARDTRVKSLTTPAINDIVKKTVELENSMYDRTGRMIATPKQAMEIRRRIKSMENLVQRLRTIPADNPGVIRARLDPSGRISATVNPLSNPSTKLKIGQGLDQAGPASRWGVEALLRALMAGEQLNEWDQEAMLNDGAQ